LAEAAAGLSEAEANLANVKAPPTKEEIEQLEANLKRAQAVLAEVVSGPTDERILEAEATVRVAEAQLAELLADAREEDLQAAGAQLLQTQADVREAQSNYDQVRYGDPDDVLAVGVVLEKATLRFEAAQADYNKLVNGATQEQVNTALARVDEAEANLARVEAGSTPEQIAQAQADVARAEAELARLLVGATDEEIAIAEARVETAQAAVESARASVEAAAAQVDSAQVQVEKTQLRAPFNGTVGRVTINEGEYMQNGQQVIAIGDFSKWQIETDDLTEIDVVDVQPGAKVSISVDALPEEDFEGEVVRITPQSETKAGDVTYTVLIDITNGNTSRLKWGMTTFVDIEADSGIPR
jgi:multidrug resistance efflux pump